jgi:G3E family GTPase
MKMIPVYVLSGFLGSGKTTLLTRMLDNLKQQGKRPAVIMNEIGDVNLDGLLVDDDVPMTEMLNGCICCTIRGDLSSNLIKMYQQDQPDVIIIESTGIANPLELIEGITNASLIVGIELRLVTTVISAPHFHSLMHGVRGKTLRLMEEQIRCADLLLLNKVDQLTSEYNQEIKKRLVQLNPHTKLLETLRCNIDMDLLFTSVSRDVELHDQNKQEHPSSDKSTEHIHHHTHNHVMYYTHRFDGVVDREKFEKLFNKIPAEVYRAKGIIKFAKDQELYMFQFAYRELEIVKIKPQQSVKESVKHVAVFIGDHFDKIQIKREVQELIAP